MSSTNPLYGERGSLKGSPLDSLTSSVEDSLRAVLKDGIYEGYMRVDRKEVVKVVQAIASHLSGSSSLEGWERYSSEGLNAFKAMTKEEQNQCLRTGLRFSRCQGRPRENDWVSHPSGIGDWAISVREEDDFDRLRFAIEGLEEIGCVVELAEGHTWLPLHSV